MNSKTGLLYIVATPIGNLADMTARAVEVLSAVDLLLAEDTRQTSILLQHFNIRCPMISCHEHNEQQLAGEIMPRLEQGQHIALVSDAGTPLISDPGFILVREARRRGIAVVPIPGPCALIAALSASGLPTDQFRFAGFAPARAGPRKIFLARLAGQPGTQVLYESSHRIIALLEDIIDVLGAERQLVIARELTKKFEQYYSGSVQQVLVQLNAEARHRKGEFVVMIAGASAVDAEDAEIDRLLQLLLPEMSLGSASRIAARWLGINRKRVYELGLARDRNGLST